MKNKKIVFLNILAISIVFSQVEAQNVAINATGAAPAASAMLDVSSTTMGSLIPRMTSAQRTGIAAPATGLEVYDLTTGSFWYFNGVIWVQEGNSGTDWLLSGNTLAGTEFIGSINAQPFMVRTTNLERMRVDPAGLVGIGTTTPRTNLDINGALDVGLYGGLNSTPTTYGSLGITLAKNGYYGILFGQTTAFPNFMYDGAANGGRYFENWGWNEYMTIANHFTGIGLNNTAPTAVWDVYAQSGNHAIFGHTPNTGAYLGYETAFSCAGSPANGAGFYATNPLANYVPFYTQSTGAANFAAGVAYSSVWIPFYALADQANGYAPIGLYGQTNYPFNVGGYQFAVEGYNNRTAGGNAGWTIGIGGYAVANTQDGFGVYGYYSGTGGGTRAGGYFTAGANWSYVADNVTNRKINGAGGVSEIIPTVDHGRIMLTCPESPEYWYQDYGTIKLVNGKAHVDIDPILADIIVVDNDNPLKVFLQVNMIDCNGVAVVNKTATGFDLVEVNGGTHSGEVDYQIIARPKTNFGEGRFPQGPGPAGGPKDIPAAKAQNSGNRETMFRWPADQTVYGYILTPPTPGTAKAQKK